MLIAENHRNRQFVLTQSEQQALKVATDCGWLTVTSEVGEHALACWQHECDRFGRAFAVVREEPARASLWFALTSGREWSSDEKGRLRAALAAATGFVLTDTQARAYAKLGTQAALMKRLLAADALSH